MTGGQADPAAAELTVIQADVAAAKCQQASQGIRLLSRDGHVRGRMPTIRGIQGDVADPTMRADRIGRRLGLTDTEH